MHHTQNSPFLTRFDPDFITDSQRTSPDYKGLTLDQIVRHVCKQGHAMSAYHKTQVICLLTSAVPSHRQVHYLTHGVIYAIVSVPEDDSQNDKLHNELWAHYCLLFDK